MRNIIIGLISSLVGILLLVLHTSFARLAVEYQNKVWGFHFGADEVRATGVISMIVGSGFIVFGLLAAFQIIRFK